MKKLLLLLTLLLSISTYVAAQNYTEVVYLKNGSIIKGVIIEQVPNVSLKIKTSDGSLIICKMDEVSKITKEELYDSEEQYYRGERHTKDFRRGARVTLKGYKGFVDAGYLFDTNDNSSSKLEVTTSHGYQFNNYFYLGGGTGVSYYGDRDLIGVPVFLDFRANFINKKITPFADVKAGYTAGDIEGVYTTAAVGVRFSLKGKKAINLKLEYSYQESGLSDSYSYTIGNSRYYYYEDNDLDALGIKVGFEF